MVSLTEFTKKSNKNKDGDDLLDNIEEDFEEEEEKSPVEKKSFTLQQRRGTTVNTNYKLKNNILKNIDGMTEEIESVYELIAEQAFEHI